MTGSKRGIQALTSKKGFSHMSLMGVEASALDGCRCCKLLWGRAQEDNAWLAENPQAMTRVLEVVALDARKIVIRFDEVLEHNKFDPLGGQQLSRLRFTTRLDENSLLARSTRMTFDLVISADRCKYFQVYLQIYL
jgi:hypothetical protein